MLSTTRGVRAGRGAAATAWLTGSLLLAACGFGGPVPLPQVDGVHLGALCRSEPVDGAIVGTLRGSPIDPRLVWLVDGQGRRLELAWPPGFSVDFGRDRILDEHGARFASIGARLELTQTDPDRHAGTAADPYPVRWRADGRCLR